MIIYLTFLFLIIFIGIVAIGLIGLFTHLIERFITMVRRWKNGERRD